MPKKPESRLQLRIRKSLEDEFGGWWVKIHGNEFQRSGLPDLFGCVEGLFFAFEVKMRGDIASELQYHEIEQIRSAGGIAAVVNNAEQAIDLVRKTLTRTKIGG